MSIRFLNCYKNNYKYQSARLLYQDSKYYAWNLPCSRNKLHYRAGAVFHRLTAVKSDKRKGHKEPFTEEIYPSTGLEHL